MVTEELLHVTTNYKTDPKILTAVCILAYELISTNKIKGDTMVDRIYLIYLIYIYIYSLWRNT